MGQREWEQERLQANLKKLREEIAGLTDPETLAGLLLEAVGMREEESKLTACLEVLRLLVGNPSIGEIVRKVGDNPLWDPYEEKHLSISRPTLDKLCLFLIGWGYPEVAGNISFWDEGVGEEVRKKLNRYSGLKSSIWKIGFNDPPITLDTGIMLWQIHDQLGRPSLTSEEMTRLPDPEFVAEYLMHMCTYDVPTRCTTCYRPINFWMDARMIAGAPYCPLCFPEAVKELVKRTHNYEKSYHAVYFQRAADLLPTSFMAPEPPPPHFHLRPEP
jgi:hypothetical protein